MKARKKVKKTDKEVLLIWRLYHEEHWTQARLAREFNMSEVQIGRYVRGVSRRDVLWPEANQLDDDIDYSNAPEPTPEEIAKAAEALSKPAKQETEFEKRLREKVEANPLGKLKEETRNDEQDQDK